MPMTGYAISLGVLAVVTIALIGLLVRRPESTGTLGGRILAFLAFFCYPGCCFWVARDDTTSRQSRLNSASLATSFNPTGRASTLTMPAFSPLRTIRTSAFPSTGLLHLPHRLHPVRRPRRQSAWCEARVAQLMGLGIRPCRVVRALREPGVSGVPRRGQIL